MEGLISEIMKHRSRNKRIVYCGVKHKGQVLLDRWFEAEDEAQEPQPVYSVSKTVTALLIGAALDRGLIASEEAPVQALLPDYGALIPETLKLKHLLTMTAGYDWPEIETFGSPAGVFRQFAGAADPVRFVLERERVAEPGVVYAYNTGASHLLMAILRSAAGQPPDSFAREVLWQPLGLPGYHARWRLDGTGLPFGGHGLSLTAEGMNRLGDLLLGLGAFDGAQVIGRPYMERLSQVQVSNTRGYRGYGYQTWVGEVSGHGFYGAFGHGGQRIYAFPELALQVVFLSRGVTPEFGLQERILRLGLFPDLGLSREAV